MSQKRAATADQVARLAGVSRSAVSRAFTEGASVSPGTRAKVAKAARKLGYRPNLFARSLKTRRSNIVGLAVTALDNQFYPEFVQRMSEVASTAGYRLLLFITHGVAGPDPLLEELLKYRLDALVLASSSVSSKLAEECRDAGVPVVMFNNVDPNSSVTSVTSADAAGARIIAQFLMAAGHQRFGFIAGLEADSSTFMRETVFRDTITAAHLPAPARAPGLFTYEGACHATRTLLTLRNAPDAIFCTNDQMAFAALQVARHEFGLAPGKDISIVGFDNSPIGVWPSFGLTTYSQPMEQLVQRIVELVRLSLMQALPRDTHEVIPGELVVRTSARLPATGLIETAAGQRVWRLPD